MACRRPGAAAASPPSGVVADRPAVRRLATVERTRRSGRKALDSVGGKPAQLAVMALLGTVPAAGQLARKTRGAFYTPEAIATFLSQWAIRCPTDAVFEPSCGEAAFLAAAATRLQALGAATIPAAQLQGTDIDSASVGTAVEVLRNLGVSGQLAVGDFFDGRPRARVRGSDR